MEMRSSAQRDHSSPLSSFASRQESAPPARDVAGNSRRTPLAAASLPAHEGAVPAFGRALPMFMDDPPRWFVGCRLRFSCDLDVLDEMH